MTSTLAERKKEGGEKIRMKLLLVSAKAERNFANWNAIGSKNHGQVEILERRKEKQTANFLEGTFTKNIPNSIQSPFPAVFPSQAC